MTRLCIKIKKRMNTALLLCSILLLATCSAEEDASKLLEKRQSCSSGTCSSSPCSTGTCNSNVVSRPLPLPLERYPIPVEQPVQRYVVPQERYVIPQERYYIPQQRYIIPQERYVIPQERYYEQPVNRIPVQQVSRVVEPSPNVEVVESNNENCCQVLHPKQCYTDDNNNKRCFVRRHKECSDICSSSVVSIQERPQQGTSSCQYIRNYPYAYCGNYERQNCGQCYSCGGSNNVRECSRRSECSQGCRQVMPVPY